MSRPATDPEVRLLASAAPGHGAAGPHWLPYALVVLLIATLVISLAGLALWQEKQRYRERAVIATQNMSRLFDQQISDIFDKVDVVLQSVVIDIAHHSDWKADDLNAYLAQREKLLPEVVSLRIADRDGAVRFGTGMATRQPVDVSDREYFAEARRQEKSSLIISGPTIGRNTPQWNIKLARRLSTADGRFAGVVHANIPTSHFERVFSGVDLGTRGAASIRTADLTLVHRFAAGESMVGSKDVSERLRQAIEAQPEAGDYLARTAIDGIERSNSYRRLRQYPFYVIVGLATDDYLGGWQQYLNNMIGLSLLTIMLTSVAALLVYRASQRQACEIAERSRIAEELRQNRGQLEELVERRTADLQASNDQLAATQFAMDQAGIGIHWIDADSGRLLYVNECAARMLGYSAPEMLELAMGDIDPSWRGRPCGEVAAGLLHDHIAHYDTSHLRRDGSLLPAQVALYMLPARSQGPGHLIAFVTDISERKNTEASLLHDKEEAESATQAKSNFLAQISHEIRTPMNAILGLAHLLRHDELGSQQLSKLDKIIGAAQHLLQIINDTLDLAKIDAGKLSLEEERFQLGDIFDHVVSLTADTALAKQLDLEVQYPEEPLWLLGDLTRLRQILLNYVSNAIKFTSRGSVRIAASVADADADQVLLRMEVRDTGIGIAPHKLQQLFQPFEQAEASTAREFGGTGLGLAISRSLAELMHGQTGASSTPGVGSTFWCEVLLPRCQSPDPETAAQGALASLGQRALAGARVLLAEDHPLNREVAVAMLEEQGLQVDVADNGQRALELAAAQRYDLILLDIQMPVMDGLAATRAIRALPGRAATPIIALTANAFLEDRQRCQEAGMDDFVAKPVSPEKLFSVLQKWLGGALPPASPPTAEAATGPAQGFRAALAAMPGVDVERAFKLVLAGLQNYADLLRKYADGGREDLELLDNHVLTGDYAAASRVAHSIKGVSLFFGFARIGSIAADLEKALLDPDNGERVQALAGALASEQRTLLEGLFAALAECR